MGYVTIKFNETQVERELRWQETKWGVQELREALQNARWMPPHSFKLRDADETRKHRQVLSFRYRPAELTVPWRTLKAYPQEEQLRLHRECGYHFGWDDPYPGGAALGLAISTLPFPVQYALVSPRSKKWGKPSLT